ncbi:MAG: hypothetical protein AB1805_09840 [Nitrospirota bacterium]
MKQRERIMLIVTAAFVLSLIVSSAAHAALNVMGPIDPNNGFPKYYQDSNGLALELCIPNVQELADGACLILPADVPSPLAPIVFPTNFPGEAFWWAGGTIIDLPGGGSADLVMALEAAFAFEEPIQGDQVSFGRVRIRVDIPAPGGNYVVTTPYGIFPFNNVQPGVRAINMTQDIGITVPGVFTGALGSSIGPYLRPSLTPGGAPLPFFDLYPGSGKLYIAQPAALGPVTGGPFGNVFRVEGPNIGGPGINSIETVNFELVGRLFDGVLPTPLTPTRTTYSRTAAGQGQIDIFADSAPAATVTVSGGANMPPGEVALAGSAIGNFFATINLADATVLPPFVTLTANAAGSSASSISSALTDSVTISKAEYNITKATLTIMASSSDKAVPPSLTADAPGAGLPLGTLTNDTLVLTGIQAPPASVIVTSSAGGSATAQVALLGSPQSVGIFRSGIWNLDVNTNGIFDAGIDLVYNFGLAGDKALSGDWNGDGKVKIGAFRGGRWFLDANGNGAWNPGIDFTYSFGLSTDIPVTGDWNGDTKTKIGTFRNGQWFLDNGNGVWNPGTDTIYTFGSIGDTPVAGDWTGNGKTKIGVFRGGTWTVDINGNGLFDGCAIDGCYSYGSAGDIPVTGDWTGNGRTRIGVFRNGAWTLDLNGNGILDACGVDACYTYGVAGDQPVTGNW